MLEFLSFKAEEFKIHSARGDFQIQSQFFMERLK